MLRLTDDGLVEQQIQTLMRSFASSRAVPVRFVKLVCVGDFVSVIKKVLTRLFFVFFIFSFISSEPPSSFEANCAALILTTKPLPVNSQLGIVMTLAIWV